MLGFHISLLSASVPAAMPLPLRPAWSALLLLAYSDFMGGRRAAHPSGARGMRQLHPPRPPRHARWRCTGTIRRRPSLRGGPFCCRIVLHPSPPAIELTSVYNAGPAAATRAQRWRVSRGERADAGGVGANGDGTCSDAWIQRAARTDADAVASVLAARLSPPIPPCSPRPADREGVARLILSPTHVKDVVLDRLEE
ncbi:unnamed protein product [Urochloa humidicola]